MKNIYSFLLFIISFAGYAQLTAGDISFIAFNTDGDDDFAIVALTDISASQVIYFTDNEPDGVGGLISGEGIIEWTTPASTIAVGTVVTFTDLSSSSNVSTGSISKTGTFNLSNTGDAILSYIGSSSTPTNYLAGIQNATGSAGANFASTGLVEGFTFSTIANEGLPTSPDGGIYNGARTGEFNFYSYLSIIGDTTNWTVNDDGETLLPFDATSFSATTPACDIKLTPPTYICNSNTTGVGNDGITINIPYSGSDASTLVLATDFVLTPGSASLSQTVDTATTGTFHITGLTEGNSWSLAVNTGDCNGLSISGSISTVYCDPFPAAGTIIINEIMQDPDAVSDTNGEWFEVYNSTGVDIDMNGWVVSDNGTDSFTISSSLIVPANGYAILGRNADVSTNGGVPVDYAYSGFSLINTTDEIILTAGGSEIDRVEYNGSFPLTSGSSASLSTSTANSVDNDNGANWGNATTSYGSGDLGSPGAANDFTLSTTRIEIEGFKLYPNPVSNGYFSISTRMNGYKEITIINSIGIDVYKKMIAPFEEIDVSSLYNGIYFVRIVEEGKVAIKKLIIE
jgi:hypothetical protein